jgi:short-subunit dehydrogenase
VVTRDSSGVDATLTRQLERNGATVTLTSRDRLSCG